MALSTDVPDGATQRHSRMMELLTFINLCEPRGVSITQIQSHMLTVFGLKFRTTSEMIRELTVSGAIKVDGHSFYHVTGRQQAELRRFAEEDRQKPMQAVVKLIERIPDPKTRVQAMRLHRKLLELLPEKEQTNEQM